MLPYSHMKPLLENMQWRIFSKVLIIILFKRWLKRPWRKRMTVSSVTKNHSKSISENAAPQKHFCIFKKQSIKWYAFLLRYRYYTAICLHDPHHLGYMVSFILLGLSLIRRKRTSNWSSFCFLFCLLSSLLTMRLFLTTE